MDCMLMQYQLNSEKLLHTICFKCLNIYVHVLEELADKYTYNFDFVYLF